MPIKHKFLSNDSRLPDSVAKLFAMVREEMNDTQGVLRRRLPLSTLTVKDESSKADAPMIITGIANLAQTDRWGEVMRPDSCAKYLDRYLANPIMLRDHVRQWPIGIATNIKMIMEGAEAGLHYEAIIGDPRLAELTSMQVETRSLLAQKILRMNSVGFIPHVMEWDDDAETLTHIESELIEISLVAVPMQQGSSVTSVKNLWRKAMSGNATDLKKKAEGDDTTSDSDLLKEIRDTMATCASGIKTLVDAYTADNSKSAARIGELEKSNSELSAELKDLKEQSEELLKTLKEAGITTDAE